MGALCSNSDGGVPVRYFLSSILLLCVLCAQIFASGLRLYSSKVNHLVTVQHYISSRIVRERIPAQRILVVFDIDNTLLTTPKHCHSPYALQCQYLGGVAWYSWQRSLLKRNKGTSDSVARNVPKLNAVQNFLFALTPMELVEHSIPRIISRLERRGVQVLIETARSPSMASVTEQQLSLHHIKGFWSRWSRQQRTDQIARCMKSQRLNQGLFTHGIFYVDGADKGKSLQCLLRAFPKRSIDLVVFVDDTMKNIKNVKRSLRDKYMLALFQSVKMQPAVDAFLNGKERYQYQAQATMRWQRIHRALATTIPELMFDYVPHQS